MKKICYALIFMFLNIHTPIKTSDLPEYDSSPETEIDIYECNNYQEFEPREVAINSTLFAQLHQCFTHDALFYKEIEYDEFAKKYASIVNNFIETAARENKLTKDQRQNIDSYVIIGEKPFDRREPLYDCATARNKLITLVQQFIDENENEVCSNCIGHKLDENPSIVVWSPGCCDIQLHKSCFQQCKKNSINKCMNLFCKNPTWTENFYKQTAKSKPIVQQSSLYDSDCPICQQPLKSDNKNDEKESTQISSNIILPKTKKQRFL